MDIERYQLDDYPGGRPLRVAINRCRFAAFPEDGQSGIILLLLHGIGFTKETWNPFLAELAAGDAKGGRKPTIKEAWAFDVPNHGESARLNEEYLFKDRKDVCLEEYARCGVRLLRSGYIKDIEKHRIIVVGHSVGTAAALWLASFYLTEDHKALSGCLLLEPPTELFLEAPIPSLKSVVLVEPTKTRRDIWDSREVAKGWFAKRAPWKKWDPRVLDAFVRHGLRELPSVWYPDRQGVTLSLPRHQEVFAYNNEPEINALIGCLPGVRKNIPIHAFISEQSFLSPDEDECKELLEKKGITHSKLPSGSDHLVVLDTPKETAQSVLEVLDRLPKKHRVGIQRSKL